MNDPVVRHGGPDDCAAIAAIYNQGIDDRLATFETVHRSPADIVAWLTGPVPVIVAEQDGAVVAFARASLYRERACYAGIREFSVYVERAARGHGLGHAVMEALIEEARAAGMWKLIARIFSDNRASLALSDRLGFSVVGTYRRHGRLDGAWKDCVIVEKFIAAP